MRRQDVAELHRAEPGEPVPSERDVTETFQHSGEPRDGGGHKAADQTPGPFLSRPHVTANVMIAHALDATARRDWTEALGRWKAVSECFPHVAAAYLNMAVILRETGRLDEAEILFCDLKCRLSDNYAVARSVSWHPA